MKKHQKFKKSAEYIIMKQNRKAEEKNNNNYK